MTKNKNLLIGIGVVVLIIIVGGGYFLFFNNKPSSQTQAGQNKTVSSAVKNLSPEDIGFKIKASDDKKKIQFAIDKFEGIKAVTYEITYEADSTEAEMSEGSEARIPRGITGDAEFKAGATKYQSPWLDLGSCSKNVCKYDKGVDKVDIILKITKDDGVYQVENSLEF